MHFSRLGFSTLCLAALTVFAQAPANPQQGAAALKESLTRNQASLHQYTWVETTQISLKGKQVSQVQKQCSYGPDGKVQKAPLPGTPPPQQQQPQGRQGGRLRQKIVKEKTGEMKDYMERVAALVHEYVPPDPMKLQAVETAGNMSAKPSPQGGAVAFSFKNYLKDGDLLQLTFDPAAKVIREYGVHSYLDSPKDDAVSLDVKFARLPDMTNYAQQSILNVPGKKINVTVTNSNYMMTAGH